MRRILSISLILFAAFLLVSCSDDDNGGEKPTAFDNWNDPKSPNYKPEGYNPIVGHWQMYGGGYKVVFTSDFKYQTAYSTNDGWEEPFTHANYIINDKEILLDIRIQFTHGRGDKLSYSLSQDGKELFIEYPGGGEGTYYRLEEE